MKSMYPDQPAPEIRRLALRPREAATALGMSEKALWDRTFPRGDIPAVKVGTRTLYAPHQIQQWLDQQLAEQQREAEKADTEGGNE